MDELGRCVLHPTMQLKHQTTSGEWRVLLSECPLCISGLPATAATRRPIRTPENLQQQKGGDAEEIEGLPISGRKDDITFEIHGRDKNHKSKKHHHIGSLHTSEKVHHGDDYEGEFDRATGEIQPRPSSRNRRQEAYDVKGTPRKSSKAKVRHKDNSDIKSGLSSSPPELCDKHSPILNQPSHSQAELLLRNIQGATETVANEEGYSEVEALTSNDSNRHSWGQQQSIQENFKSLVQNSEQGLGQYVQQEVYCSEIKEPSIPNHLAIDPHSGGRMPVEVTGIVSDRDESVQKRPDPKDIGELAQMHHSMNQFHHEQQLATYHPPPVPPSQNMSNSSWNAGQLPVENSNQHSDFQLQLNKHTSKVFEQDEVSVMTMSSVTQQMHTQLQIQRQRQRQGRHRHQLEDVKSDDESSTTSTDSDDDNGRVPSVQSAALMCKVSDTSETKSASSKSASSVDRGKINTCDCDERGWCRRHPTTVQLRKKNIFRSTWQVLLSDCPECCLDEMKRVRDVQKQLRKKGVVRVNSTSDSLGRSERSGETSSHTSSRGGRSGGGNKKASRRENEKKRSSKTNKNPPISQLNLRSTKSSGGSVDHYDDTRSVGTASTVTNSSHTHSTGGRLQSSTILSPGSPSGSANDVRGDYANQVGHSCEDDCGSTAHVTRMPYIDEPHGWCTGQVDPSTGTPHGDGAMNYAIGAVCYSEWSYGMSANHPTEIQEEPFSLGGGGGYIYPRQPRHHHSSYRSPIRHSGRSYLATLSEDGTSSDYEYADGPPTQTQQQQQQHQQQQQSAVVCGMMWMDQCGNTGAYTGEVNFLSIPHGIGSMRYDQGDVSEGMWRNGEIVGNVSEKYRSSSSPSSSSSLLDNE